MKMFTSPLKLILTVALSGSFIYAQCPLPEKIVKSTSSRKSNYRVSTQSKSGALKPGGTYEMSFVARSGFDYKISSDALNDEVSIISFEIFEMVTRKNEKNQYKRMKHVISKTDGKEPVEFATDKTRKIMIKVTLEALPTDDPQCMAVLIEHKKSTKIGLE
ncbi:MAG: hypothetical protein EP338_13350 [Bacteroidetes bacterium]|nr:MAG: hypothetical protein EP338_13350 [Bacteroidota bacterium]